MSQPPSKDDLRGQLSEIQKKLFGAKRGGQNILAPDENHPLRAASSNTAPTVQASRRNLPTPGSSRGSHDTPTKVIPQPRAQLKPESKGQDMNFVVGLSENLLSECRRLAAENLKMKSKLKTQADEIAEYKTHVSTLSKSKTSAADSEIQLKDKNWELEINLSKLKDEMDALKSANERLVKTHNETTLRMSSLQRDNEELALKTAELGSEMRLLEDGYNEELADLRERIDNLNDENDHLLLRVSAQNRSNDVEAVQETDASAKLLVAEVPDLEDPTDLDRIIDEFTALPINILASDPSNAALDLETLKANVANSNKTIQRLRAQLLKLKSKPTSLHNTPRSAKKLKYKDLRDPLSASRGGHVLSPRRNSQFILLNELEDEDTRSQWANNDDWEQFENTPSKPVRGVNVPGSSSMSPIALSKSDIKAPALHDSDSSEAEFDMPVPKPGNRILSQELSNALGSVTEEQVQRFAKDHDLVLLSLADFAKLEHNNIEDMSADRLASIVDTRGHVLVTKEEYHDLLDEQEMKNKLAAKGLVTIHHSEYQSLNGLKTKIELPELEYLTSKLDACGYSAVPVDRLKSLEKSQALVEVPTETFIASKAKGLGLHTVGEEEFSRLNRLETEHEKPSKEYLKEKANEMGLILSSIDMYDELKRQALEPTIEHLQAKAKGLGHVVVSEDELQRHLQPSLEQVKTRAEELDHDLVTKGDLKIMTANIESPLLEYLKQKASSHDHQLISHAEINALKNPDLDVIGKITGAIGYSVIKDDELAAVQAMAHNPSLDHLVARAAELDYQLITNDRIDELEQLAYHPSLEHVKEVAHGFYAMSIIDFEELQRLATAPNQEELSRAATKYDLVVVSAAEYDSICHNANEPSVEHLASKASALNLKLISTKELQELNASLESPSLEYLSSKAAANSKVLVPEDEYISFKRVTQLSARNYLNEKADLEDLAVLEKQKLDQLVATVESPSIEHLTAMAARHSYTVIPTAEYETPPYHYLEQKADSLDMMVVDKDDFQEISQFVDNPPLQFLMDQAKKQNHVVISSEDHEVLAAQAHKPTLEQIREKALSLNHVVVPSAEHEKLQDEANNPSLQTMIEKVRALDHVVLPDSEFQDLKRRAESPLTQELEHFAKQQGLTLVAASLYATLVDAAESPSKEKIIQCASTFDLAALPYSELQALKHAAEDESFDKFKHLAEAHNHAVVTNSYFESVKRRAEIPTLEEACDAIQRFQYTAISNNEFKNLQTLAHNPDIDHLSEQARTLNHIVISESDHEKLKTLAESPDFARVGEHAAKYNHRLISTNDYQELEALAHKPDINHVEEVASVLGYAVVEKCSYDTLIEQARNPTLERLQELCSEKQYTAISCTEHHELLNPKLSDVKEQASKHAHVCLSFEDSELLHKLANEFSEDRLASLAAERGQVLLPIGELKQLQEPSLDDVRSSARRNNCVVVDEYEYNQMVVLANDPSLDQIKGQSAKHSHVVIPQEKYQSLVEPSMEYLQKCANGQGATVIASAELSTLKNLAHAPPATHIDKVAGMLGLATISSATLAALKKSASNPSVAELTKLAKDNGFELVGVKDLAEFHKIRDSPDLEFVKSAAEQHHHTIIPDVQYHELEAMAHSPEIEHVQKKAADLNYVVLLQDEHSALVSRADDPPLEHLKKHAEQQLHRVLGDDEYAQLKRAAEHPEKDFLISSLLSLGYVLVPSEEFQKHLEDKENAKNMKLIPNEQFEMLNSVFETPSLSFLMEKAKNLAYVVVESDKYKDLVQRDVEPTKELLTERAAKLGYELVPTRDLDNYKILQEKDAHPSIEDLLAKSKGLGFSLVDTNEFRALKENLTAPPLEYLTEKTKEMDYILVSESDFKEMKGKIEGHNMEFLEEKAKEMNSELIQTDDLDKMRCQLDKPDFGYLTCKADEIGFTVIEKLEHAKLKKFYDDHLDLSVEFLQLKAQEKDHTVLPTVTVRELETIRSAYEAPSLEYLKLKTIDHDQELESRSRLTYLKDIEGQYHQPTLDYVREHAKTHNQVVLTEEEESALRTVQREHDFPTREYLQEKADSMGHVLLEKEEVESYKNIERQNLEPSIEYLREKAKSLDHVILGSSQLEDYKTIKLQYELPSVEYLEANAVKHSRQLLINERVAELTAVEANFASPSLEYLSENLPNHNHIALTNQRHEDLLKKEKIFDEPTHEHLAERALTLGSVIVAAEKLQDLERIRDEHNTPSIEYLTEKSAAYDHSIVQTEKLKALESIEASHAEPSLEYLTSSSQSKNHILVSNERHQELISKEQELSMKIREIENPHLEYLEAAAHKVGSTLIASSVFSELTSIKEEHELPSIAYLQEHAAACSHEIIPLETLHSLQEYKDKSLVAHAEAENCAVIPTIELDQLKFAANEPLTQKAENAGMIVVAAAEFESMNEKLAHYDELSTQVNAPTAGFLGGLSLKLNSVVVGKSDYDALKNPSYEKLLEWGGARGYALIHKDELTDLKKSVAEPLETKALRNGFKIVAVSDYDTMLEQLNTPSLAFIGEKARAHNQELVDIDEVTQMRREVALTLEERATRAGLVVVSVAEFTDMYQKTHEPTLADIESAAASQSHAVVPKKKLEELETSARMSLEDRVAETEYKLITERESDEMAETAEQLKIVSEENMTLVDENKTLTNDLDLLTKKVNELELREVYLMPILTQQASLLGYSLITNDELETLELEAAKAKESVTTLVDENVVIELYFSRAEVIPQIKERLGAMGYSVVEKSEVQDPVAQLTQQAESQGFVVLTQEEHKNLQRAPTIDSVLALAAGLSMTVLPASELTRLKQAVAERDLTIHELQQSKQAANKDELVQKLRNLDMVVLTKDEYQQLKEEVAPQKAVVTEEALQRDADGLGLTIVPNSEYHEMKRALAALGDQNVFKDLARKWNMLCIPELAFVPSEVEKTPEAGQVTVVPTRYYNRLTKSESMNIETVDDATFKEYAEKKGFVELSLPLLERIPSASADTIASNVTGHVRGMTRSNSLRSIHSGHSHGSFAQSITALSIATNISFTDKSMIPAITQVVIGEYLFKYYRKLGPLSAISSSRHERYFWVHPYSLTLYWSSSNPVLTNPSEVKTKAMAIIRVEGVEDPNPLPPGLHYKSIIVHSQTGSIKITCPTRQRHNIWLNALRYLVNRNANEGISLRAATAAPSVRLPHPETPLVEDNESVFDANIDVEPSTRHAFPRLATMPRIRSVSQFGTMRSSK